MKIGNHEISEQELIELLDWIQQSHNGYSTWGPAAGINRPESYLKAVQGLLQESTDLWADAISEVVALEDELKQISEEMAFLDDELETAKAELSFFKTEDDEGVPF